MNSLRSIISVSIAVLAFQSGSAYSSDLSQVRRLQKALHHLPTVASAIRVNKIVTSLVKLQPRKAYRYYRLGISHLPQENSSSSKAKIALAVLEIMKKAGLDSKTIDHFQRRFIPYSPCDCEYIPHETPTPEPTP